MKEELLKGLTEEQIVKVKECKNQEELLSLAKKEGVELTEDQLNAVNGGGCFSTTKRFCPTCNKNTESKIVSTSWASKVYCKECGTYLYDL